jgi:hypothetical protein
VSITTPEIDAVVTPCAHSPVKAESRRADSSKILLINCGFKLVELSAAKLFLIATYGFKNPLIL